MQRRQAREEHREVEQLPELRESRTFDNLREAFASDAQDVARFAWFATHAEREGELELAVLLRAAARTEAGHAQGHLDFLREVQDPLTRAAIGSSEQNLKAALARTTYESETMFPAFARTAREEGFDAVADWFERLAQAQARQQAALQRALEAYRAGVAVSSLGDGAVDDGEA